MNDLAVLTEFFGWCTLINSIMLAFLTLMLTVFKGWAASVHSKLLGMSTDQLDSSYLNFLANYKLAILVFSLVPYIALKVMA